MLFKLLNIASAIFLLLIMALASVMINLCQIIVWSMIFLSYKARMSLARRLSNMFWDLFPFAIELWSGVPMVLTGDHLDSGANAILIGNHSATPMDFAIGVAVASRDPLLGCGGLLALMKEVLKYVPIVGWTCYLQGNLFLKRKWEVDHKLLSKNFSDMENNRVPSPFWIGVYPEGTRVTPKKLKQSQEFARKRGYPVFNHCMIPRTKGFIFVKQSLPTSLKYVYDCTVFYEGGAIFLGDAITKGEFRTKAVHVHTRRIPFEDLPSDEKELNNWLVHLFHEKDELMEFAHKNLHFPGSRVENYKDHSWDWILFFLVWCLVAIVGSLYFFNCLTLTGFIAAASLYTTVRAINGRTSAQRLTKRIGLRNRKTDIQTADELFESVGLGKSLKMTDASSSNSTSDSKKAEPAYSPPVTRSKKKIEAVAAAATTLSSDDAVSSSESDVEEDGDMVVVREKTKKSVRSASGARRRRLRKV
jgi:lysophosphatidic acid acyltransferase / lysophosphatidylinositol acyltransferase